MQEAGFDLEQLKAMEADEVDFWFGELVTYREAAKEYAERDR